MLKQKWLVIKKAADIVVQSIVPEPATGKQFMPSFTQPLKWKRTYLVDEYLLRKQLRVTQLSLENSKCNASGV